MARRASAFAPAFLRPRGPQEEVEVDDDEIELWPLIVGRMVMYVEQHMYDSDEGDCVRVFTVWSSYLKRLRCESNGEEIDAEYFSLQTPLIATLQERQCFLEALGVVNVALKAIATHPVGKAFTY